MFAETAVNFRLIRSSYTFWLPHVHFSQQRTAPVDSARRLSIVDRVAGADDFETAVATYRATYLRCWKAKITLRQGTRVVVRNWRDGK
jgi:hypothetical protein